ncbi:permease [Anoxybacillus gonensis]|uniref:Permease n=1 Tax=Anoxybacillus gonensis TaxID=198467 RepID=A0AAW7THJ5_9BACL|nr:DUF6803 family protein [Anoxybacillus gonensis]AKS38819.1 permease [Anoxybacillus gonensis]KGP60074.1 permease [Anoxybacillus gonensis]MDO0876245.1 permease [Anoxybacillus gonensis]
MSMTHYMELLAVNQPWNLILFMAIPVILAETVAITELAILFTRRFDGNIRKVNKICSIIGGIYFLFVFIYLFITAVIPLTMNGEWRGWIDVIAVTFYLLGVIPLFGLTLLDLHVIGRNWSEEQKLKVHAIFVGIFLIVAHIAMIFGMLDPSLGNGQGHHMNM